MRKELFNVLENEVSNNQFCLLTADLGFDALEGLQDKLDHRFINVGVAEQNLIGIAAGLAKENLNPWCYSIAPFLYARAFEQIRNDVCFNRLSIKLIGNGGGFGYGVMGATHHCIEDYGVLSTLPHFKSYIPAFDNDIKDIVDKVNKEKTSAYIRLGLCEWNQDTSPPKYQTWRELIKGKDTTSILMIICGPLASKFYQFFIENQLDINLWVISELPIQYNEIPNELLNQLESSKKLILLEEHIKNGGMAEQLCTELITHHHRIPKSYFYNASWPKNAQYGSQEYHRAQSNLTPNAVKEVLVNE